MLLPLPTDLSHQVLLVVVLRLEYEDERFEWVLTVEAAGRYGILKFLFCLTIFSNIWYRIRIRVLLTLTSSKSILADFTIKINYIAVIWLTLVA